MSLPTTFVDSNFRTRAEYDESLKLDDEKRAAAEAEAAAKVIMHHRAQAMKAEAAAASSSNVCPPCDDHKMAAVIIIGMAGSGKTTLMQRLNAHLFELQEPYYMVNLDPAVLETPFGPHIDIRDTVNYKEVMKQYALGPNGGILTSLNLFATRFEQVLGLIAKRKDERLRYALFDTPGQIEIFTWSASGQIITESLAAAHPTVIVYVVDTVRCRNAVTFMSNMLYACSILYKLKLPLVLAFNKTDAQSHDFAIDWMTDLDAFQEALQEERSYMGSLAQSMALMLEEFYKSLTAVGVSALTGDGVEDFFKAVDKAAAEYETTYAQELKRAKEIRAKREAARQAKENAKMRADGLEAAGAKVMLEPDTQKHREAGETSGMFKAAAAAGAAGARASKQGKAVAWDEREDEGAAWPEEEEEEDYDEPAFSGGAFTGAAGYTVNDEKWAAEHPNQAEEKEDYESLMRYLQKRREGRGAGPAHEGDPNALRRDIDGA